MTELKLAEQSKFEARPTGKRWQVGPARRDLTVGEVEVWLAYLDLNSEAIERLGGYLSAEEKNRAAKFHFEPDRRRYIATHGFLREVLSRHLRIDPIDIAYSPDNYGKPSLQGASAASGLSFNLSRSRALAACALVVGRAVGVDIEYRQPIEHFEAVARHNFAPSEYLALMALPEVRRERAFYACWTRKEAYVKALGQGLSLPLNTFAVSVDPATTPRINTHQHDSGDSRWSISDLNISEDYAGALVVDGRPLRYNYWQWK